MDREETLNAVVTVYGMPPIMRCSIEEAVRSGYNFIDYYARSGDVWRVLGFIRGFNKQPCPISLAEKVRALFDWEKRERHQMIRDGYARGQSARVHYRPQQS